MKTKSLLFISFIALSLFICKTQAMNTVSSPIPISKYDVGDPPPEYEKIDLLGTLMYGINPNAIVAGANDNSVYIGFNQDFGNVNISIYNGMGGLVYSTVVNTSVQSVVIIPFTSAASGSYTVELSNADGDAEGDFDKD